MSELAATRRDIFILALVLIIVVYFAGATSVGKTFFAGVQQILLTVTGQKSPGVFGAYPGNAPQGGA